MSDTQRRLLCRLGFMICCLLPTMTVGSWILFPASSVEWSSLVEAKTGCNCEIGSLSTPSPNQVELNNLSLSGPDIAAPILLEKIQLTNTAGLKQLTISPFKARTCDLSALLVQLHARLSLATRVNHMTEVYIKQITLERSPGNALSEGALPTLNQVADRSESYELFDVYARVERHRTVVEFQTGWQTELPVKIELRNFESPQPVHSGAGTTPPRTASWSINTNGANVPCWLLDSIFPSLKQFGDQCSIIGTARCDLDVSGRQITSLSGHMIGLDIQKLVEERFGHILNCRTASVDLGNCRLVDGRLESMFGRLELKHGVIGKRLLDAMRQWLNLATPNLDVEQVEFQWIHAAVEIRDGELEIWAIANNQIDTSSGNQTIATYNDDSPMINANNANSRLPIASLINCLTQETVDVVNDGDQTTSAMQVPASTSSQFLMQLFELGK